MLSPTFQLVSSCHVSFNIVYIKATAPSYLYMYADDALYSLIILFYEEI